MRVRALRRLDEFFALADAKDSNPEVTRHFRRNFLVNSADGVLWLFGASFVSVNAILPVYAARLTDSPLVIGLIPALTDAGWFLPQLFMAPWVESLRRKYLVVIWLGMMERLPYLVLAIAALWLSRLPTSLALAFFIGLMVWKSFASGLVAMPWQELIATVIPVSHRGRFFGFSHFGGQLLGVAGASLAAVILARLPFPRNFALSFFVGFLGMSLSLVAFAFTVEAPRAPEVLPSLSNRAYLRRLSAILRENANFRTYLFSRALWYLGSMAFGFMAVYAVQRFRLPDAQAGVFTAILFGGGILGYALWGPVGDRLGHRHVLLAAGALWVGALLVALLAKSLLTFYAVFALMGVGSAAGVLGDLNIAMEFGPERERPTYIGLARTTTAPAIFVAPLLGGGIVSGFSYPVLFGVSLFFALLSSALLAFRVVEPRHTGRASSSVRDVPHTPG